jgi:L-lactate dehydrogenase complex protein LldG
MAQASARDSILSDIRAALQHKVDKPFPDQPGSPEVFKPGDSTLRMQFEQEFTRLLGQLFYCRDSGELTAHLSSLAVRFGWNNLCVPPGLFASVEGIEGLPFVNKGPALEADAALTDCECLIARTGTIVLSSAQETGRALPVFTPVHLVVAFARQLLPDVGDGLAFLKKKYSGKLPSAITYASGPSRTGDIEKTLVVGVHGPGQVFLFIIG